MSAKLGLAAILYRLLSGSRASWGTLDTSSGVTEAASPPANLDEVPNVRDLSINLEKSEADVTTRGNNGWRARLGALKDGGIEFGMVYDSSDSDFAAIMTAWLKNTSIAFAILDGDKSAEGTEGFWADFQVLNISKTENLEEAQMCTVTIKPTYSSVAPEWVRITA
jgi:hypothetical protein